MASASTGSGSGSGVLREEVIQGGVAGLWVAAGGKERSFQVRWVVATVQGWMTSGSWVGVRVREDQATVSSSSSNRDLRWKEVSQLKFASSPSVQAKEAVCRPLDTHPFPVPSHGSLFIDGCDPPLRVLLLFIILCSADWVRWETSAIPVLSLALTHGLCASVVFPSSPATALRSHFS